MSPEAAPPLPSQLEVHFLYCSANPWLIVESFVSFDPVYPCCCIVCDLRTKLSRSNLCLTLTSSGWDTLQKLQTSVRLTVLSSSDHLSSQQHSSQSQEKFILKTTTSVEPQTLQNILQVFLQDNFPFRAKVNTKQ